MWISNPNCNSVTSWSALNFSLLNFALEAVKDSTSPTHIHLPCQSLGTCVLCALVNWHLCCSACCISEIHAGCPVSRLSYFHSDASAVECIFPHSCPICSLGTWEPSGWKHGWLSVWACCRRGHLCMKWLCQSCPTPPDVSFCFPQLFLATLIVAPEGPLQYLCQGGDMAKTQWDDAENLELPLVKVWPVAADGSDQQLAMARFRHCRFLTIPADGISVAEASFLLQPKWHKPSVGDGCGRCWSLQNWWLLLSSGDNWVSFERAVFLICLRSKHSVEDRWIQQSMCEIWDNNTTATNADQQVSRADGWPVLERLGITGPLKPQDFALYFFTYSPYFIATPAVHLLLCQPCTDCSHLKKKMQPTLTG